MSGLMLENLNPYNCFNSSFIAANEDIYDGDPASDVINLSLYESVMFIIFSNATVTGNGTATITIESCDNVTPDTTTAVAFHYKVSTSGNTWGATTAATTSGFTTTQGANQCYIMEVRADALSGTDQFVRMKCTEVRNYAVDGAIGCILGRPRYSQDVMIDATS